MGYLVAAYTVAWVAILIYLWSLSWRWEGVREEIGALRKALSEREAREIASLSGAAGGGRGAPAPGRPAGGEG